MRPDEVPSDEVRRPRALRRGDRVAVLSPSGPLSGPARARLADGVAVLHAWGLQPEVGTHALDEHGYLAGDDVVRADDLNRALRDPGVRAVLATRGGYGATRMVDLVDWQALREDPIWLVGYSDITALHAAAWQRTRTVTVHGQFASRLHLSPPACAEQVRALLFGEVGAGSVLELGGRTGRPGETFGRVLGGNLALVASLIGSVDELDLRGALLLLEDVGEVPYRVDRTLIQLLRSTVLDEVEALLLGRFVGCDAPAGKPSRTIDDVLHELVDSLDVPAVVEAPLGHTDEQVPLPLGVKATFDADARTLTLLEDVAS